MLGFLQSFSLADHPQIGLTNQLSIQLYEIQEFSNTGEGLVR
jgi:hypothetical protein